MITVITGTPGAGKTLYAISKLIQPLVGTTVKHTQEDGTVEEVPRTIYTNINGLLLDHELIDGGENHGLRDWWKWAKPGSVIVFDEVQRIWQPRPNGSKVPEDIQMLETHRHMGVDFILITQNVMLLDRNIQALGGRHLHVRRIANAPLAIVYEWDHISRQLLYAKSLTKSPWRYDKKVFKLYKSAEVHTKQPRKLPGLLWFILIGIAAMAYLGPTTYARMSERTGLGTQDKPKPAAQVKPATTPQNMPQTPAQAPQQPLAQLTPPKPKIMGCISAKDRCKCYDDSGELLELELQACTVEAATLKRIAPAAPAGSFTPPAPYTQAAPTPAAATSAPTIAKSNGTTGWVDRVNQPAMSPADVVAMFPAR